MRRRETIILIAVFVILGALAVELYRMAGPSSKRLDSKPLLPEGVAVRLEGKSRVTSNLDGRLAWTMTCDGLVFRDEEGRVEVESPSAVVPLRDGGTVEVKGSIGYYFQDSQDMLLEDDVAVRMLEKGVEKWLVNGDTASYRKEKETFYMAGLAGVLATDAGDTVAVSGQRGMYITPDKAMRLERDVKCLYKNGMTLETDELEYLVDENLARTPARVRIEGEGFRLKGKGMRADMAAEKIEILGDVDLRLEKGARFQK